MATAAQFIARTAPRQFPEPDVDAQFETALAWLLPAPIAHHGGRIDRLQLPLHAAEEMFVRDAVERRRMEFTAGRTCARAVLEQHGIAECTLGMGPRREPLWPDGVVGSISHAAGYCVAAACTRTRMTGIGIDIEAATPLSETLFDLVCTPHESAWCQKQPERLAGLLAKFLFSAKESVFKCLYPVFREELEFADVTVDIDLHAGRFIAHASRVALGIDTDIELHGRLACTSFLVMTSALLPCADIAQPAAEPYEFRQDIGRARPFQHCWH